jgi:Helix-turn-helix
MMQQMHAMRLDHYLQQNDIKPEAFAEQIGVHTTTIYRFIQGTSFPKSSNLKRIAEVTGGAVQANDFIGVERTPVAHGQRGRPRKTEGEGGMARRKKGDEYTPSNSATAEEVEEIIGGIENEKEGLVTLHMEYMQECKPFHERIAAIVERGEKAYGMTRKSIKAKVKERELLRKADQVREKLDSEEAEAFDRISDLLGPLGRAARDGFRKGKPGSDPLAGFSGPN